MLHKVVFGDSVETIVDFERQKSTVWPRFKNRMACFWLPIFGYPVIAGLEITGSAEVSPVRPGKCVVIKHCSFNLLHSANQMTKPILTIKQATE
jgi:hypothetical protein